MSNPIRSSVSRLTANPERVLRRLVEPLYVVDRDDRRGVVGELLEDAERGDRDGTSERALAFRLRTKERHVDGVPLRRRQPCDDPLGHRGEHVAERRVAELRLGFDRPARDDVVRPFGGDAHSLGPHRRLADARLAFEQQRDGPGGDGVDEVDDLTPLGRSSDDRSGVRGHARPSNRTRASRRNALVPADGASVSSLARRPRLRDRRGPARAGPHR
jgi:hypothetical protein